MSEYKPVLEPEKFSGKTFQEFSKKEAAEYLEWFLSVQEERLAYLEEMVKRDFPEWQADYSRDSLVTLYEWFKKNVSYRLKTPEEYEADLKELEKTPLLKKVIQVSNTTLSDKTVNVCFDTGIYFARCINHVLKDAYWKYLEKPKDDFFYHRPVLTTEKTKVVLEPVHIMLICARSVLSNSPNKKTFTQLYETWIRVLEGGRASNIKFS